MWSIQTTKEREREPPVSISEAGDSLNRPMKPVSINHRLMPDAHKPAAVEAEAVLKFVIQPPTKQEMADGLFHSQWLV